MRTVLESSPGTAWRAVTVLVSALCLGGCQAPAGTNEPSRWAERAARVTIVRDDWGIPHVHAATDADAVFGLMYAQAEDDFPRIEENFLNAMGRLAEAEGERRIWRDLRMKLFIDPVELQALYAASPEWLRALMDAWADGLNWYLHTHPEVRPRVITRFEPWMALTFSEGSIGGDIERVDLDDLQAFYGDVPRALLDVPSDVPDDEPGGSNGFAIAPSNSATGNALLLINPHTSFFFRSEVHVTSDEGLDAYGAVTWGQFFVYQGFNADAGWMHTSSGVDNIDEYAEEIVEQDGDLFSRYGDDLVPVETRTVVVPYTTDDGLAERTFTVYRTRHGPVVRAEDDRWISVRLMERPLDALIQSYTRTKARNLAEFRQTMELHTNSSNNTVFADSSGNIAYFHANFIPRRDEAFDWTQPVDGTEPATEWNGVLSIDGSPNVVNPPSGWIQNTNNWPFSAAGAHSPKREDYPDYVQRWGENFRGVHAVAVLSGQTDFTLESLIDAAFDDHLPAFDTYLPALFGAYANTPDSELRDALAEPIATLSNWDRRWALDSVPTTLAACWGDRLWKLVKDDARRARTTTEEYLVQHLAELPLVPALSATVTQLTADFGTWRVPWGEINRFQRLTGDIKQPFDDAGPSLPVAFTSARWGSLAAFGAKTYPQTKKLYGTSGNSFVAAVEFGQPLRALAVTAGGLSNDPSSPHFNDQAERYVSGDLREVYFTAEQLAGHVEREYRPGL